MKYKVLLIMFFLANIGFVLGQSESRILSESYILAKNEFREKIDSIKKDPNKWSDLLDLILSGEKPKDTTYGKWMNGLNLEFKNFQNQDSTKSSLGFAYGFNIERARISEKQNIKNGKSISLESKGNVAINKLVNPYDFLSTKIALNFFHTFGGVKVKETNKDLNYFGDLRRKMAMYESSDEILKSPEWKEINEKFVIKNSLIIKYDLNAGYETNQDFSKTQKTIGVRFGLGYKSWNQNNLASKLNIIDYPFEFIRRMTGYDGNIHPGITIPSLLIGYDYVNPYDTLRKNIEGELKSFSRINAEIGFRTVLTEVSNQLLYFNCSFKYFKELGASQKIKDNHYSDFSYFSAALTTSGGLFVSYSNGKLPLDRINDAVYEIGFKFKLD